MSGQQQVIVSSGGRGEGAPQNQSGGVNYLLRPDGTCNTVSGVLPTPPNWYTVAPQPGVGDFYWIKATDTGLASGTAATLTGASISAFTNLATAGPSMGIPSGIGGRNYSYQISSSASGTPVVATGTGQLFNNA